MVVDEYEKCLHILIRRLQTEFIKLDIVDFECCSIHNALMHVLCDLKDVLGIMVEKHEAREYDESIAYTARIVMKNLLRLLEKDIEKMLLHIVQSELSVHNQITEFLWRSRRNLYRATEAYNSTDCPKIRNENGHIVKQSGG